MPESNIIAQLLSEKNDKDESQIKQHSFSNMVEGYIYNEQISDLEKRSNMSSGVDGWTFESGNGNKRLR